MHNAQQIVVIQIKYYYVNLIIKVPQMSLKKAYLKTILDKIPTIVYSLRAILNKQNIRKFEMTSMCV